MKEVIRGVAYEYQLKNGKDIRCQPWLMLHGFTGTKETFSEVLAEMPKDTVLTVDLLGHGGSFTELIPAERYQIQQQCLDLKLLLEALKIPKVNVLGYSMGGRVALAFALYYPELVQQLVLESSSPGLRTIEEQEHRQAADKELANKIEVQGVPDFVAMWEQLPLFASQQSLSQEKQKQIRQERLSQKPLGLSLSLKAMGTGSQPSYWPQLSQLRLPVNLIVGALDQKFKGIAEEMNELLPNSEVIEFPQAGHAVHLEQPCEFADIVKSLMD